MPKGVQKQTELKPSDRRRWPTRGDRSIDKLYSGVGRALSQWETYEGVLSLLFSYFILSEAPFIARRAYNAVRTFEGRADMLRAASHAYFTIYPNENLQADFKKILSSALQFSPRRNDIAHGVIGHFRPQTITKRWRPRASYGLFPSYANFKDRDVTDTPAYCYTSKELLFFFEQFFRLTQPANQLSGMLISLAMGRANASRDRQAQRYRASTNPTPEKKGQQ